MQPTRQRFREWKASWVSCGLTLLTSLPVLAQEVPPSSLERPQVKPRVIVSSDIGGSDPDDFQSAVHLMLYANELELVGLLASPPGMGRVQDWLEVIDAYEQDFPRLQARDAAYPTPDRLRAMCRQGATKAAPANGFHESTAASEWIVAKARSDDPRPLWVLVWGSLTDVAQAIHDHPEIKPRLRVYSIGSWNTRQDPTARDYLFREHPDLWWIESDTTFRGMYVGGEQEGELGNRRFVEAHVQGHGALGDLFWEKKRDIKMGDTPSVLYLLRGDLDDPTAAHWGGAYVLATGRTSYWTDDPDPQWRSDNRAGAKQVSRWREHYLRDWQQRMDWLLAE